MKTRGERQYINMPLFGARLYDNLTHIKGVNKGFDEIAEFITHRLERGELLDIGTGPGRLLDAISQKNPKLGLFGLDISKSMIAVAGKNLKNVQNVDLRVGNIVKTEFQSDYFDAILCTGSFYNWDSPVEGLNEVFRILKSGKTAYFFETTKDYDEKLLNERLGANLQGYPFLRRRLSKYFLNKQLRMTYTNQEFDKIILQTEFRESYKIEPVELGDLPIYLRIELRK